MAFRNLHQPHSKVQFPLVFQEKPGLEGEITGPLLLVVIYLVVVGKKSP